MNLSRTLIVTPHQSGDPAPDLSPIQDQFPGLACQTYAVAPVKLEPAARTKSKRGLASDDDPAPQKWWWNPFTRQLEPVKLPAEPVAPTMAVNVPAGIDLEKVRAQLATVAAVRASHRPCPVPHGTGAQASPQPLVRRSLHPRQGYLEAAPEGIGARLAWPHGKGKGTKLAVIERGWKLPHRDLPTLEASGSADWVIADVTGHNHDSFGHGTAVLGILAALHNRTGCDGIAPEVDKIYPVSLWENEESYDVEIAVQRALEKLGPGDVLLIVAQADLGDGKGLVPVEALDEVFTKIKEATDRGITVVEAAGNGSRNLDGLPTLKRTGGGAQFRDSGAILVGAAQGDNPRMRHHESNHGSRIDCFAWGERVYTTGDGRNGEEPGDFTAEFGGTSAAAAMVAGAALLLQSIARKSFEAPLKPADLRTVLSAYGTPCERGQAIGIMPDLEAVVGRLFQL